MSNDLKSRLNGMKKNYAESKAVYDTTFGGVKIPAGDYIAQLQKAEIKAAKSTGKLMIARQHIILSGDYPGVVVYDYMHLETPMGFPYARKWIDQMGYTAPDDPEELLQLVEEISGEKAKVKINLKHSGDFTNISVIELLDDEGEETTDPSEDTQQTEESTEESTEETATEEDSQVLKDLRDFVIAYGLDGYKEAGDSDEEQLKEMILAYPWKEEEMEPEEIQLFVDAGIDDKIIKPKPKKETKKKKTKKKK